MEKRESWGSRFGFIMTAAGFSIGLGKYMEVSIFDRITMVVVLLYLFI